MENEYKFRQCPKDKNIQWWYMGDKCGIGPIAESAPKRRAVTNAEYIRGLDDKGICAFFDVAADGNIDIMAEQCSLCRYGAGGCGCDAYSPAPEDEIKECNRALWRWLHDEARALIKATEEKREEVFGNDGCGAYKGT